MTELYMTEKFAQWYLALATLIAQRKVHVSVSMTERDGKMGAFVSIPAYGVDGYVDEEFVTDSSNDEYKLQCVLDSVKYYADVLDKERLMYVGAAAALAFVPDGGLEDLMGALSANHHRVYESVLAERVRRKTQNGKR